MIVDYRNKWNPEDLFGLGRGTFVTDFSACDLPYYQMTTAQFPDIDLEIHLGKYSHDCYSLHAGPSVSDLSKFWRAYEVNKAYDVESDIVLNTEIICLDSLPTQSDLP